MRANKFKEERPVSSFRKHLDLVHATRRQELDSATKDDKVKLAMRQDIQKLLRRVLDKDEEIRKLNTEISGFQNGCWHTLNMINGKLLKGSADELMTVLFRDVFVAKKNVMAVLKKHLENRK